MNEIVIYLKNDVIFNSTTDLSIEEITDEINKEVYAELGNVVVRSDEVVYVKMKEN